VKTGIQFLQALLDSRFRGSDIEMVFLSTLLMLSQTIQPFHPFPLYHSRLGLHMGSGQFHVGEKGELE
jgi:hypothetical protein